MKDINKELRKSYYTALTGIIIDGNAIPVFYMKLPTSRTDQNYIVYRSINNNDGSTKNSSDTFTNVTVECHSYTDGVNNNGNAADDMANEVLQRLYPTPQSTLTMNGGIISNTEVASDVTQDFTDEANRAYISRYITFRHAIFQTT